MSASPEVLCDFQFTTVGGALSLSPFVASFLEEVSRRKLTYNLHALGTNVEAPLHEIFELASWLIAHLQSQNEKRAIIDIRIAARFDREQNIAEKIDAVRGRLGAVR